MSIQRVSSKWAKTLVLLRNKQIAANIPLTMKYSQDALIEMLKEHTMVYIKPDIGTFGNGVMCAERITATFDFNESDQAVLQERYVLKSGTTIEEFTSTADLHRAIRNHIGKKVYLIQRGIHKLKYNDRSFDLRVLTQKTPKRKWETTGIVGRVAGKNKIITNYHGGGTVKMLDELLAPHASQREINLLEKQLNALGEETAKQLQKEYPKLKEIGLDVAIDTNLYPWILEVNTLPAIFPFKKFFKDKSIYQRIERYAIAYGRISAPRKESKRKKKA
ncbi:YheC/YheD family protein [Paenibacillus sp. VCA1]|uniref:YheC/YheD family protein n=1 Tax=Paenibacillus sp. VCA1 TaxID=3039148 RepID=UPI0028721FBF|nr:YheC/YheD family protein [Paenibacillus sp. VCA1]MDR9853761.1 YheC/YheD family protein [Paenibacillus sp. VCA1]